MVEYISFITTFNAVALLMRKYRSPLLLVIANVLITLVAMTVVEIMVD
ncbi:hypothetical protein [Companilactobacillus sp.]|nr:hypothetical protein [Companilactobacillus sp.]